MRTNNILKLIAIAGFVTLSLAAPMPNQSIIKQKLAERVNTALPTEAKLPVPTVLAQTTTTTETKVESEAEAKCDDDCGCGCDLRVRNSNNLSPCVHPCEAEEVHCGCSLGSCAVEEHELALEQHQAISVHESPDVRICREEKSASCSNQETTREECAKGCKFRHFCIKGDICVSEKVTFKENSIEDVESEGYADKNTCAVEKCDAADLDNCQQCYCAEVKAPMDVHLCDCEDKKWPACRKSCD